MCLNVFGVFQEDGIGSWGRAVLREPDAHGCSSGLALSGETSVTKQALARKEV